MKLTEEELAKLYLEGFNQAEISDGLIWLESKMEDKTYQKLRLFMYARRSIDGEIDYEMSRVAKINCE